MEMNLRHLFSTTIPIGIILLVLFAGTECEAKRKRKFDGDFEFVDDQEEKVGGHKDGKKTWILDPGSDLCQALNCKKKELCLLEDEFTAVCVSKRELHRNGDLIIPKSKAKGYDNKSDEEYSDEDDDDDNEDDDSDYYDDDYDADDSLENVFSNPSSLGKTERKDYNSKTSIKTKKSSSHKSTSDYGFRGRDLRGCTQCPVMKPNFLCGSDNKTYSSLCSLDYHNCIQNVQVTVTCEGFCPCKDARSEGHKRKSDQKKIKVNHYSSSSKFRGKKIQPIDGYKSYEEKYGFKGDKKFGSKGYRSGYPLTADNLSRSTYMKYKEFTSKDRKSSDKLRRHNEVVKSKPTSSRDCSPEGLESMRNRLLDWFSVVMADVQKRPSSHHIHNYQVYFPGDCKREVQWMFTHLNVNEDMTLSEKELYDLENDRNEKCIKPFIDTCDTDKDRLITTYEWCGCFAKSVKPCISKGEKSNCGILRYVDDHDMDDDDSDFEGSGADGPVDH